MNNKRQTSDPSAESSDFGDAASAGGILMDRTMLVAANEHLVVAALRAQTDAAVAINALNSLSRSSELDFLTELPNRQSLVSRFAYAIAIARRTGTQLATLFVDLDNFKQINDKLGHAVGDQVLRLASQRLATAVRESDTVSRHGGDEFLILLTEVSHVADVVQIATKLISALARPARIGEHVLRLSASIGISMFPDDGRDIDTLIRLADEAMYRAKAGGVGGFAFHGKNFSARDRLPRLLPAPHHPLSHYRAALAEQARRHCELRDANEQLVLTALNAQKLQETAEQAQSRQTTFLAVLAHELRNPLVPMRDAAALLHRARFDQSLLPRIQTMIERQVAHMARLIGDILDVSRMTTGKLRLEQRTVDLADSIRAAEAACRPDMDARLQHLAVQLPLESLHIYGDALRLTQIFVNLLDNASKYSKDGAEIKVSCEQLPGSIVICVADVGIGMTAQVLATIFEPFIQDTAAIEFNGTGLGIGLTVVHELVLAHGGTVVARSAGVGLGSTFVVTLPRTGSSGTGVTVSERQHERI
jgi:diguanylate cyclase